jgi:phosphoglycerate kinase
MKLRTIRGINIQNKKVLLRVDFNVAFDERGRILDDFRVRAEVPSARALLKKGAKLVIIAHLGRPVKGQEKKYSMRKVAQHFAKLLGKPVYFGCMDDQKTIERIGKMKRGEIVFLENIRFFPEEEKNDAAFACRLAALGDIYVNDAFAVSHRAHASVHAITKYLPSYAGETLERECNALSRIVHNPKRPLTVIVGGAKISTKMELIRFFMKKGGADHVIVGGALANTVLLAQGIAVGKSLVEKDMVSDVKKLDITGARIHLPCDVVVGRGKKAARPAIRPVEKVGKTEAIYDIGPYTAEMFRNIIVRSRMVIWNGPMGFFEKKPFARGTHFIARAVIESKAFSIIGGGETAAVLDAMGIAGKFSHISTGGGAMMEFLAGKKLPALSVLIKKKT